MWANTAAPSDPFELDTHFKRSAKAAHKEFNRSLAELKLEPNISICELTSAVILLTGISTPHPSHTVVESIISRHPTLANLAPRLQAPANGYDSAPLRARITALLSNGQPDPSLTTHHRGDGDRSEGAAAYWNTRTQTQPTHRIAPLLPSTATRISGLRDKLTDPIITNPKAHPRIAKNFGALSGPPAPTPPPPPSTPPAYITTTDAFPPIFAPASPP